MGAQYIDGNGVEVQGVLWDRPEVLCPPRSDLSRAAQRKLGERIILLRTNQDYERARGRRLFDKIIAADERPDFSVRHRGDMFGIELIALTIEERRKAYSVANTLKSSILASGIECPQLKGRRITVQPDRPIIEPGKPFGPEGQNLGRLGQLIALSDPPELELVPLGNGSQEVIDGPDPIDSGLGWSYDASPVIELPRDEFCRKMGFDIVVAFTSEFDAAELWARVQRKIDSHQGYEARDLVLSIAAPDPLTGILYPGDLMLYEMLKSTSDLHPLKCENFKRLIVHNWYDRKLFVRDFGVSKG